MERGIRRLTGHYIICGAGGVGRSAARELARKPLPFVVIDTIEEKLRKYSSEGWLTLVGDATLAKVLQEANIEKARGLVAATTTDAINIYIILAARSLNPTLKIIARASEEDAEKHLLTAGADSVVSPYNFAGYRIAQTFMRPNVIDFFDTAMNRQQHLEIEEINVADGARVAGVSLTDCAGWKNRLRGAYENHDSGGDARDRPRQYREIRCTFAHADGKCRVGCGGFRSAEFSGCEVY